MVVYNEHDNKEKLANYVYRDKGVTNANKLWIITGYTGPESIKKLQALNYDEITVFIGMYGRNINPLLHNVISKISSENSNIKIYYTNILVHSKIYIWANDNNILEYAIGSANFSANALYENCYKETLETFSTDYSNNYSSIKRYLDIIINKSTIFNEYNVVSRENFIEERLKEVEDGELTLFATRGNATKNIVGISSQNNAPGAGSGLNWGFSNGLPLIGDAYIPLSSHFFEANQDFFGEKNPEENKPIEVIWDDGEVMLLLLEGNRVEGNKVFPKQISTYKDKSELGRYLRKRIGEKIGKNLLFTDEEIEYVKFYKNNIRSMTEYQFKTLKPDLYKSIKEKFITKEMLEQYGRSTIKITKIDEDMYEFDFSS